MNGIDPMQQERYGTFSVALQEIKWANVMLWTGGDKRKSTGNMLFKRSFGWQDIMPWANFRISAPFPFSDVGFPRKRN